jgi:hypothetical protein
MRTLTAVEGSGKVNKAGVVLARVADLDLKGLCALAQNSGLGPVTVNFPNRETVSGAIVSAWPFDDGVHLKIRPTKVKKAEDRPPYYDIPDALRKALHTPNDTIRPTPIAPQRPQPNVSGLSFDDALRILLHGN